MEVATVGIENKIELKPITLGRNLGTDVEVIKGLTMSDRLVNSPPDSLSTGDTIRIAGQFGREGNGAKMRSADARETRTSRPASKER